MTPMYPALGSAFAAPFARFGETLVPPRADAVKLADIPFPALARRYAASFPSGGDPRAALSLWSQYYLLALVPCAAAVALVAAQDLPVAVAEMGVVLGETGQPTCLCLPHGGCDTAVRCPVQRLAPLIRSHLAPLGDTLAAAGLPRPVFWSNAAVVLAWSLRVIALPEPDRAALQEAMAAPCWGDGGPNPFRAVLGKDPARRGVCCLRFRLGGVARCSNCPVAACGRSACGAAVKEA